MEYPSKLWMSKELENRYSFAEDDICAIWYVGLMIYNSEDNKVTTDALILSHMAIEERLDYNRLFGFYKIVVHNKMTNTTMFWTDNSGSGRFYYNSEIGVFADTLDSCAKMLREVRPCYEAIYQYFAVDRTLDNKTIVDGVFMSACDNIYIQNNGSISSVSKGLKPFSKLDPDFNLKKLMKLLSDNIDKNAIAAVVTGGTDSRCVLSHLVAAGINPKLIITGRSDSNDVRIAKKIAGILKLPLSIYDPAEKEIDWIKKGFEFSSGTYDVVLSYRHLKKAQLSLELGATFEFGGVGGEFYKNSYCRPIRYRKLFGKTTADDIINNCIGEKLVTKSWYGDKVVQTQGMVKNNIKALITEKMETGFLRNYNIFAELMLSGGFCSITNMLLPYITKVEPLMDRNLIASVCYKNPFSLTMARWQRREIHDHCPKLSEVETDQGLSCSVKATSLLRESLMMLGRYIGLATNKIKRKILRKKKSALCQWQQDYIDARNSHEYESAVKVCKKLGIISEKAMAESLPIHQVGFILMVGLFFEQYK